MMLVFTVTKNNAEPRSPEIANAPPFLDAPTEATAVKISAVPLPSARSVTPDSQELRYGLFKIASNQHFNKHCLNLCRLRG